MHCDPMESAKVHVTQHIWTHLAADICWYCDLCVLTYVMTMIVYAVAQNNYTTKLRLR